MVGKLKKFSATLVFNTFSDSVIMSAENRVQPTLFQTLSQRSNLNLKLL
jgi:hypothetical protein